MENKAIVDYAVQCGSVASANKNTRIAYCSEKDPDLKKYYSNLLVVMRENQFLLMEYMLNREGSAMAAS